MRLREPISDKPVSPAAAPGGTLAAVGAFLLWGLFPLYWAQISSVPAIEVIWHRILWGGVLAWIIVAAGRVVRRRTLNATRPDRSSGGHVTDGGDRSMPPLFPGKAVAWLLLFNGVLLGGNWLVYVWAVSSGRTLDASLGYYINPLVSVVFGMIFFGERLVPLQWVAVASAAAGVLYMTFQLGYFPWVSVTLAATFGLYGVVKKKTTLSSIHGLAVELTPVMVVAAVMVVHGVLTGTGRFLAGDPATTAYLFGASAVTVAPLLLFGIAARRIRLADVGFLQYIAPTLMFIIAVAVFHDPIRPGRIVGFAFVWLGLSIYTYSNMRERRHARRGFH
ncbi:MAG: EamA family transporter RarD [Spirochaeta sp.]|jgi:chloramphenicol-sensitive protein RarD|nr:EamA family transporter RarD [Spirochaeta sp.]